MIVTSGATPAEPWPLPARGAGRPGPPRQERHVGSRPGGAWAVAGAGADDPGHAGAVLVAAGVHDVGVGAVEVPSVAVADQPVAVGVGHRSARLVRVGPQRAGQVGVVRPAVIDDGDDAPAAGAR